MGRRRPPGARGQRCLSLTAEEMGCHLEVLSDDLSGEEVMETVHVSIVGNFHFI